VCPDDPLATINVTRLTEALAERLRRVAPPGMQVRVVSGLIVMRLTGAAWDGVADPGAVATAPTTTPLETIRLAASNALNDFHDYICEILREPWPARHVTTGVANPHVELQGNTVRMWFGDRNAPVLVLEDLQTDEFVQ
jgi:hypothetical protein